MILCPVEISFIPFDRSISYDTKQANLADKEARKSISTPTFDLDQVAKIQTMETL